MSVDLKVPSLGESVRQATVERWLKNQGDFVRRGEPIVALESEKANVEVPAPVGGVLKEIVKVAGTDVAIGEVIGRIEPATMRLSRQAVEGLPPALASPMAAASGPQATAAPVAQAPAPAPAAPASAPAAAPAPAPVPAAAKGDDLGAHLSPSLRRLAREHGLDLGAIAPSGPGGRLLPQDVVKAVEEKARPAAPPAPSSDGQRDGRREERVPMTSLRKRIAEQHGIKLGFMSFFVKASFEALKAVPLLNATIDGIDIVHRSYYDIGVAVGGGKGLVVPVIRNAERLSFAGIEKKIEDLATRAKDNKLLPDELTGGTFTISNGGIYGSLLSTPLLNTPQSGILGMHAIQKRPVAVGDQVVVRPMMYVALSYDHRIVDGREAVLFLVRVKECIEAPDRILLEV
ncbi:2-oxo acid dehydrogenase subunit E2 [bacterium]|nr:2-oxo acid dehydrogenase subunit E2 [bacterium]